MGPNIDLSTQIFIMGTLKKVPYSCKTHTSKEHVDCWVSLSTEASVAHRQALGLGFYQRIGLKVHALIRLRPMP